MYSKMMVTTGVVLALMAGCKQNPRTEVSRGPAAQADPEPMQSVLVGEPVEPLAPQAMQQQADGGYSQPYPVQQWGSEPAPAEMRLSQPQPVPVVTPEPVAQPNVHIVQKGDTLWSIAKAYYGSGTRFQDIVSANPGIDPKKLRVGQTLVLP